MAASFALAQIVRTVALPPAPMLAAPKYLVLYYKHINERYPNRGGALTEARMRHEAGMWVIVDTDTMKVMAVHAGKHNEMRIHVRTDWHGAAATWPCSATGSYEVVNLEFSFLGSLANRASLRYLEFEIIGRNPATFVGFYRGAPWCVTTRMPHLETDGQFVDSCFALNPRFVTL